MAREESTPDNVEFFVLHGATDAPAVDVIARNIATLVDNAAYTDMTGYVPVPATSYILDITPAEDNETIVATFAADLSGLGGGSAAVFASGFLKPSANQDGEAFGIFAALLTVLWLNFQLTCLKLQLQHQQLIKQMLFHYSAMHILMQQLILGLLYGMLQMCKMFKLKEMIRSFILIFYMLG